jgi:hypothetical protein
MTQGYFRPVKPVSAGPTTVRTEVREGSRDREWETRWNGFITINGIESETELLAQAEQVDFAERDAHEAFAHSNDAEIAYLRKPNNHTRRRLKTPKQPRQSHGKFSTWNFDGWPALVPGRSVGSS